MPFSPEIESLLSGSTEAAPEKEASYGQQFARGLGSGATIGLWEPFHDAGKGGLVETAGRIAGAGASFIPIARGAGLGLAGLSKLPGLAKLLAPGVEAGAAAANMLRGGRQIGQSLSPLGAGLAVGSAVPIQAEAEAAVERAKGETPAPFAQRMMTSALGAGIGGFAGRSMAKSAQGAVSAGVRAGVDNSTLAKELEQRLAKLIEQRNGLPPNEAKLLEPEVTKLQEVIGSLKARTQTTPPEAPGGALPEVPYDYLPNQSIEDAYNKGGLMEVAPPAKAYPSYGEWVKSGATAEDALKAVRPPSFGEQIEKTLSPEQAMGGEYMSSLSSQALKGLEQAETPSLHAWQLEQVQRLRQATGGTPDAARIPLGLHLQDQGAPMSHDLDATTQFVNNSAFPPERMPIQPAKPIGGGSSSNYPQQGVDTLRSGFGSTVRSGMNRARAVLGNFSELVPMRWSVAGIPVLENLPGMLTSAKLFERSLVGSSIKELEPVTQLPTATKAIIKDLFGKHQNDAPEIFAQAVQARIPEAAGEVKILQNYMERVWNSYVMDGALDPSQRILNYFPHVRDVREVRLPGVLQLEKGSGTIPITIENMLKQISPQFAKTRSITDPALVPSMKSFDDVLKLYVHQYGRFSSIQKFTPDINEALAATPENMKEYIAKYMNYVVGNGAPDLSDANKLVRNANFLRAIGANALSPVKNLLGMINTFAITPTNEFFQTFQAMRDPAILDRFEKAGFGALRFGRSNWRDVLEWDPENVQGMGKVMMDRAMEYGGKWFTQSAEFGRLHAAVAGLLTAEKRGLDPDAAMKFALTHMNETQFHVGDQMSNLAPILRSPTGRIIGQFQTFRMNQLHFMTRLLDTAMDGARKGMQGDIRGMVDGILPFAKFWGATMAITGPLGILPGDWAEDKVTQAVFGKAMHVPGLAELLFGVVIPSGIGVDALEARDVNSFLSYLPGPSLSYAQALMGTVSGKNMGQGLDFSRLSDPLEPEARARLGVTMLPGGVQLNRVLQAARLIQNDGEYQRAMDLSEFVGAKRPSGAIVADKAASLQETLLGGLGFQTAWRNEAFRKMKKEGEMVQDYRTMARQGGQAMASGRPDETQELLDKFNQRYEDYLPAPVGSLPKGAFRRALMEQILPPAIRKKLPLQLRGAEESFTPPPLFGGNQ